MSDSFEVIDIQAEIARFFDPSSLATDNQPRAVILAGGVAAGKTTLRREQYSIGYVVLDAAEIFLNLCEGRHLDFPGHLDEPMDLIGYGVARRIFRERRNFVVEIIGAEFEPAKAMIEAIGGAGYKCEFIGVTLDVKEAWDRNVNRGPDNISAYYAEPYHRRWVLANAPAAQ